MVSVSGVTPKLRYGASSPSIWAIDRRGDIAPGHFASRLNGVTYHVDIEPDIWTILTAAGPLVALFGIIVSRYLNGRSVRQDHKNAEATAARAEAAARLSADSTDRIVAALSTISLSSRAAAAPPPSVAWSLVPASGAMYRLTNVGNAKSWRVKIESDESLDLIDVPEGQDLDAAEAVTFTPRRTSTRAT